MKNRYIFYPLLQVILVTALLLAAPVTLWPTQATARAAAEVSYIRVAPTGSDHAACGTAASPCKSLQYAVNKASSGDVIQVAAGVYYYNGSADNCSFLTTRAVACVLDKHLTFLGGYTTANWSNPNPVGNPTIIDGANSRRGVAIIAYNSTASVTMDGFTIQYGLAQGTSSGDDFYTFAFGGGMWSQKGFVTLRNVIFKNNRSIGGTTGAQYGGAGSGGGLAIQSTKNGALSTLENVVFENNQAIGGGGVRRGGVAIGGGLFTYGSNLNGNGLTFTNNTAQAGSSSGSGVDSITGLRADALGGGAGFQIDSNINIQNVMASGNRALGGNAGNSTGAAGGGGFGGALATEMSTFTVHNAVMQGNTAIGGNGATGGFAFGGALLADSSNSDLASLKVVANAAISGASPVGGNAGAPNGGGAYLTSFSGPGYSSTLINSIFSDNRIEVGNPGNSVGGGGAGLVIQAIHADILHTTFARNYFVGDLKVGQALVVHASNGASGTPATANISYSIIADHVNPNTEYTSALTVAENSTANLLKVMFSGNSNDTNLNNKPFTVGTITGMESTMQVQSVRFASPGAPDYDYHLAGNSPAIDQAVGSSTPIDIDGQSRPTNNYADLGADEFNTPVLFIDPQEITLLTDRYTQQSRSVEIVIPTNPSGVWTATSNANWVQLGYQDANQQVSGVSGESLQVFIQPSGLGTGTHQATVDVTSPGVEPSQFFVTLTVVPQLYQTYLPYAQR